MADAKFDSKYVKEAFKEPLNFWGLAAFGIGAAFFQDVTFLGAALAAEAVYLTTLPVSSIYRRLVERREKQRLLKLRDQQREARSEERRVGKECRARWSRQDDNKFKH